MRTPLIAALFALLAFAVSCDDGDTYIVENDCGLIRTDLLGTWTVTFPAQGTTLFNCSDPAFNNLNVMPPAGALSFNDMEVYASSSNVGFFFHNSTRPEQIFGNVETDSCGMLFGFLINASGVDPTPLYLQCIGTLDRASGIVNASCDSVNVLEAPLTDPVTIVSDCDLYNFLAATITIQ